MPEQIILRASAVSAFKACPERYRYRYEERIVPEKEGEATRVGSSWHALLEVYRNAHAAFWSGQEAEERMTGGEHPEEVEGFARLFAEQTAVAYLHERYAERPEWVEPEAWEIEKTILLYSFMGYLWRWSEDQVETLVTEYAFNLPLHHPQTGMPLKTEDVVRHGTIDRIVRRNGLISIADYKSTSRSLDSDSDFWKHLRLDTQISMYVMAAQELHAQGRLAEFGVQPDEVVSGAFYDVWHRPTIRPANLTQKDTAALIETGEYQGVKFEVVCEDVKIPADDGGVVDGHRVLVNGRAAEVTEGKKGFAIRETPEMYGARLLADIYERPDHYFARREIPRTRKDIENFRNQLYAVYRSIRYATDTGYFMQNERSCENGFRCPYMGICYGGMDIAQGLPEGMKREDAITLTVEREEI